MLEAITDHLDQLEYLVFTASTFPKPCLLLDKPVPIFSHVVEAVSDHAFQQLDNTGC